MTQQPPTVEIRSEELVELIEPSYVGVPDGVEPHETWQEFCARTQPPRVCSEEGCENREALYCVVTRGVQGWQRRRICNACEIAKAQDRKQQEHKKDPVMFKARQMLVASKNRSKKRGWPPPEFDVEWLYEQMKSRPFCPVLGIPYDFTRGEKTAGSPSVDRYDSSLPYTKANSVIVSWRWNKIKSDATVEEIVKGAEWLLREQAKREGKLTVINGGKADDISTLRSRR